MKMTVIDRGGWNSHTGWSYEPEPNGGAIIKDNRGLIMGHVSNGKRAMEIMSTVWEMLRED